MNSKKPFELGIIEGFFGQPWSWEARMAYTDFINRFSFSSYLYAPKNDNYLRKEWDKPFPKEHLKKLKILSKHYAKNNIDFGIGLSPFELYKNFGDIQKNKLKQKLQEINSINPSTLCILFDDMPGALANLAQQQVAIMNFVCEQSSAHNFIICPTYYSDDPLLEQHFGKAPSRYLEDLGGLLPSFIEVFWTGPEVVSKNITAEHLEAVRKKLQRKPLIWDNYPVNDSKNMSNFLHLLPFKNKSIVLKDASSGHIANPMNQAYLSQLALHSLSQIYQGSAEDQISLFKKACSELCPKGLAEMFLQDVALFQSQGLNQLSAEDKLNLIQRYSPFSANPMVTELSNWLNNKYAFDPACLTYT